MVIHYCWFGGKDKPEKVKYCIESWKKVCPAAEIKEWNEDNFDVLKNPFSARAYSLKKYAFVADYARFDILFREGGIYLDTDVELLKDITPLLKTSFSGFERENAVAPGLIVYAEKGDKIIKEALDFYDNFTFESAEKYDFYNETVVNIFTDILVKHGLTLNGKTQTVDGFTVYATEYFNPKGGDYGKEKRTENTYSVHHYLASWKTPLDQKIMEYRVKYGRKKGTVLFCVFHPILALKKRRDK